MGMNPSGPHRFARQQRRQGLRLWEVRESARTTGPVERS